MIRKGFMMLLLAQFLLPAVTSFAQDSEKPSAQTQLLQSLGSGAKIMHTAPARIAGFEELIVRDDRGVDHVFYLSTDGKMAFSGSLLDVRHKKNLTQISYGQFMVSEIANGIRKQQTFFIPYQPDQHGKQKLYLFMGPSCPDCLHLWDKALPGLIKKYDIYLSYGGLRSLGVQQAHKAMQGWCFKGNKRRLILTDHPLDAGMKTGACKQGVEAFNRMKATFGRYIRRIPVAYNASGEVVPLPVVENKH